MAKKKPTETEMMKQYLGIKREYPEGILFFRMGDFYEMFFDDAIRASELLGIAQTSRNKNSDEPIPMAGVPHHSVRGYIARLAEMGEKVVLCDQVEDAKLVRGKRPVKRAVTRVITPGVVLDDEVLDPKAPRYLAAIACDGGARARSFGLAYLDVSTGEFHACELASLGDLSAEVSRVRPRELLMPADALADLVGQGASGQPKNRDSDLDTGSDAGRDARRSGPGRFDESTAFGAIEPLTVGQATALLESALSGDLRDLGLHDQLLAARAAGDAVSYARATQPAGNLPISRLHVYRPGDSLVLDDTAIANLELTETLMERKKAGSLLSIIDATCTAPGGRLLRRFLLYPLTAVAPIRRRQDAVQYLVENAMLRRDARAELRHVHDLERLAARVELGVASPRDLGRLRDSLARLPELCRIVEGTDQQGARGAGAGQGQPLGAPALLRTDRALLADLARLHAIIDAALIEAPTGQLKDGGFVRDGHCPVVDDNRRLARGGKEAVEEVQKRERERTGIANLRISHNRVFGYYIEVKKTHLSRVPDDYIRKQTIATAERYVTEELADLEGRIASAQDALLAREQEIFTDLCAQVAERATKLRRIGETIAHIDCCAALAEVAQTRSYVRPVVDDSEIIDIADGRHPVVEQAVRGGAFVPNDCHLDTGGAQIVLITGPNMAGKSTYMRQIAHIVLLAQIGSFVPASAARIGLCDRIFTRVGAADNLARGESTFMVEMRETAAILAGATRRSLVVLDEVGRGTSTFDGVSIAWAVTEFLHDAIGARTVFATHYHELCSLADTRPRVRNVSVAVRERAGEVVFLRRVVEGGANRSYGIDVARLAGLPRSVISRAKQILAQLEGAAQLGHSNQLSLFAAAQSAPEPVDDGAGEVLNALVDRLRAVEPNRITPMEALTLLAELRALV